MGSQPNLQPPELQDEELLGIARLLQATAILEYTIALYMFKIADITEGQSLILLGCMPASARLKLAETFATTIGSEMIASHKECLDNEYYRGLVTCRNMAVHGYLFGLTDMGAIAFAVQEPAGTEDNKIFQTARAYTPDSFAYAAEVAEGTIPQLIDRFELRPLLDKRRAQALAAHPKARRQQAKKKANVTSKSALACPETCAIIICSIKYIIVIANRLRGNS